MQKDELDLLEVLKFELQFLEDGGYGRSPRMPSRGPCGSKSPSFPAAKIAEELPVFARPLRDLQRQDDQPSLTTPAGGYNNRHKRTSVREPGSTSFSYSGGSSDR